LVVTVIVIITLFYVCCVVLTTYAGTYIASRLNRSVVPYYNPGLNLSEVSNGLALFYNSAW